DPEILVRQKRREVAEQHRIERKERDVLLTHLAGVLETVAVDRDAEIPAGVPARRQVQEVVSVNAPRRCVRGVAEETDTEEPDQQNTYSRRQKDWPHDARRLGCAQPAEPGDGAMRQRRPPPPPVPAREQRDSQ